jgi:hypothetical protein
MGPEVAKVYRWLGPHDHQGAHAARSRDIQVPGSLAFKVPMGPWHQGFAGHLVYWLNEKTAVLMPGTRGANFSCHLLEQHADIA